MKVFNIIITILIFMSAQSMAQQEALPYHQIPEYPESYNEGTVAARMVDALGFRYYWATEGLLEADLSYTPAVDVRTIGETLKHIQGLSAMILRAVHKNVNSDQAGVQSLALLRKSTLENIQQAANLLRESKTGDLDGYKIVTGGGANATEYPFWNVLNGPIADALYHTGQVVAFRRAAGNPIPPGVRMLTGEKVD